jgi:hypothetical protein
MCRQLDSGLIAEVEMLAAQDVHSAKAAICMYCNYARWLTKPPIRNITEHEIKHGFDRWERVLRAFVAYRKSGDLRSISQIEEELCSISQ